MFSTRPSAIKLIAPALMILSGLDSFLKEMPWVPAYAKPAAFYALAPLTIIGTVLLLPYIRGRMAIVTPKNTSSFLLRTAVVITGLEIVLWAAMFYTAEIEGTAGLRPAALFLKDAVLVSSAVVFILLGIRLLRWYQKTKNKVVVIYGVLTLVVAAFTLTQILPDFMSSPPPRVITDVFAAGILALSWISQPAVIMMLREYYGKRWIRHWAFDTLLWTGGIVTVTIFLVSNRLIAYGLIPNWNIYVLTFLISVFILANSAYPLIFWELSRALPNANAKEYYRSMGYSYGLWAFGTCGLGLRLLPVFPLSGFASLTMMLPAAFLAYATFTSSAAYFSISEDLRGQIRQAAGFAASMGEAESIILTEQQISQFYDRFTGMAKASGAVEEAAISKDEIYKYADALKRIQKSSIAG